MPASAEIALLIAHLDVRFGTSDDEVHAVRDASVTVRRGESFGLVGESGSGKSTILRAVAGLARDWTGRIAVNGKDLGTTRSLAFYESVQMVFQDPYGSLHPRHTIDHTLSEPGRIHGVANIEERVVELLIAVGL
ncbi:MAG: ATP-binding cassette domain-containing protein, partial [bacterium]|nr:ATP-binding cassette domain-containing protein [bacterium]